MKGRVCTWGERDEEQAEVKAKKNEHRRKIKE